MRNVLIGRMSWTNSINTGSGGQMPGTILIELDDVSHHQGL